MLRVFAGALLVIALAGCTADKKAVDAEIPAFHQELNAGQFDKIYNDTGNNFKQLTSQAEFAKLLSSVHRKLGNFVSGKPSGWGEPASTKGHFVTVRYPARFAYGTATELFVYQIQNNRANLVGYHINSLDLIEK